MMMQHDRAAKRHWSEEAYSSRPGPWGNLRFIPIRISPPQDFGRVFHSLLDHTARIWKFPRQSADGLEQLLGQLGLSEPHVRTIVSGATRVNAEVHFTPTADFVADLSVRERSELNRWLAVADKESWAANAFRFCGTFDDWFENAPLRDDTLELIQPFLYRCGNYLLFADLPLVADRLGIGDELHRLIKVLSRESTLLASLHVHPDDDLDALVNYWSRGRRLKDIRPLLESLSHFPQGQAIDIVHLLPWFARRLLFTYPPADTPKELSRDCHWTSLNFFSDVPDDRLLNLDFAADVVLRDWVRISDPPQLGDLVFFQDDRADIFHSAVYIADQVLFTKNGPAIIRPWILMHEREMTGFYPQISHVETHYYRRRDLL